MQRDYDRATLSNDGLECFFESVASDFVKVAGAEDEIQVIDTEAMLDFALDYFGIWDCDQDAAFEIAEKVTSELGFPRRAD